MGLTTCLPLSPDDQGQVNQVQAAGLSSERIQVFKEANAKESEQIN